MSPSYPPGLQSEEQADPSKLPGSVDKSEALFSMYLDRSDEDDRKTTERWKGESDAILIFTGLFSAALAALLSISIQGLQPNPQDTSAFYLGNIYHLLANTTTQPTTSDPPNFSPQQFAVLVNSLWFLSLVMSLTGALLAVFIQQWSQSYLRATQARHSPRDRARIRAYHAEGFEKWDIHQVTRAAPILIHISLFLFFSGLPMFLFNVNRTVFNVVVTWLALCMAGYAYITLMPVFCQDSPYFSPLSSWFWFCLINILFIILRFLKIFIPHDSSIFRWYHRHYAESHLSWPSLRTMQNAAASFALQLPSKIDYTALLWMFGTLSDDDKFEEFFDALPSLCDSKALANPQGDFINPNKEILSHALIGMMDRTLLSDLVPEEVKQRRIIIYTKVINKASLLEPWWTLRRVLFGDWHGFSRSVHFGLFVQGSKSISQPITAFYAQYVIAVTLASVRERDDNWFQLASGQLKESKSLLRGYYGFGDSILLANAIFIIRRTIQTFTGSEAHHRNDIAEVSKKTLESICRFDINHTLPEHQHQFCGLWNQLVDATQNDSRSHITTLCKMLLKSIRRLYLTQHKGTPSFPRAFSLSTDDDDRILDDARSFPRCEMEDHAHSLPVPELQLGELPSPTIASSIDMVPAMSQDTTPTSTSDYVPPLPPSTQSQPYPFGASPYYPVTPSPYYPSPYYPSPYYQGPYYQGPHYPDVPGPYTHSAPPAPREDPSVVHVLPPSTSTSSVVTGTMTPNIDASYVVPRPLTTTNHLERPFVLSPMVPETLPAQPSPTPTSATGSGTTPVPPAILSSPQERMSSPSTPPSVPQEPPLSDQGTSIPLKASQDSDTTRHISVSSDIPSPTTATASAAPETMPNHGTLVATAPSAPSSRHVAMLTPMTPDGGGLMPMPSPSVGIPGLAQNQMGIPSPGNVMVNAAMTMPSPSLGAGGGPMVPVLKFNGYGEFSGLLYHSPHSVVYEEELYPTALHLFEARKFLDHRPDLADWIRQCERVEDVTAISAEMAEFTRRDWGNVALSTMDDVLYLKFRQHSDLRTLLLSTYPAELVYTESGDPFWGDGVGNGLNEFGKSLRRVRERIRFESGRT